MATATRTDIHRPSAINPEEYQFVALGYQPEDSIESIYSVQQNRAKLEAHRKATGATYSQHAHGGNCHVCGAHCIYTVIFWHRPTNTYIRTGMDCAEKMGYGDPEGFRAFRQSIHDARRNQAGKAKAKALLTDEGLESAWDLAHLETDPTDEPIRECQRCRDGVIAHIEDCDCRPNSWGTLRDIVRNVVRYGDLSDKQADYLRKLIDRVERWPEIKAEREARRQAERDAAEDCPTGRQKIEGEVISTRYRQTAYGEQLKMLVRDDRGFKVWGSVPSALQILDVGEIQRGLDRGDRVEFTATIQPSDDDAKFGFFKRPSKAKFLG